ncbi:ankyrin [Gigaspora margarita]|uniref:Ankyrin n=1 Tax=Gigaspora margarita TaxID=4874 RepID=A0A8H4AXZ0_GIGMA|nr:ankyrin [Gigaspora margarita]
MPEDIFSQPVSYDINYTGSIGNTALHYAAQRGFLTAAIYSYNAQNSHELETPLHMAVQYTDDPSVTLEIELKSLLQKATLALQMDTRDIAQDYSDNNDPSSDLSDDDND